MLVPGCVTGTGSALLVGLFVVVVPWLGRRVANNGRPHLPPATEIFVGRTESLPAQDACV